MSCYCCCCEVGASGRDRRRSSSGNRRGNTDSDCETGVFEFDRGLPCVLGQGMVENTSLLSAIE